MQHGFSNSFSPAYRVEVIEDQPPALVRVRPTQTRRIVAPNSLIQFDYRASDELPLKRIEYFTSHNGASWQPTQVTDATPVIEAEPTPLFSDTHLERIVEAKRIEQNHRFQLDLVQYAANSNRIQPGDEIRVMIRATDWADNIAESKPVRLAISSVELRLAETDLESRRAKIASLLHSVTDTLPAGNELQEYKESQLRGLGNETAKRLDAIQPQLASELTLSLESNEDPSVALELLSVSLATRELSSELGHQLEESSVTANRSHLRTTLNRLRLLTNGASHFVAHDSAIRHLRELQSLLFGYQSLADQMDASSAADGAQMEQLKRQQSVLNRQLLTLTQGILDSGSSLDQRRRENRQNAANRLQNIAANAEDRLERATAVKFSSQLAQTIQELSNVSNLANLDPGVYDASLSSLRTLHELVPPVERILQPVLGNSPTTIKFDTAVEQLRQRRSILRSDRTAVPGFAADLGQAARALTAASDASEDGNQDAIRSNQRAVDDPARVRAINEALRTLQLANDVEVAQSLLRSLLEGETQLDASAPDLAGLQANPRRWDRYESNLDVILRHLESTQLPEDLRQQIRELRWNTDVARAKDLLLTRRWSTDSLRSASGSLLRMKKQWSRVQSSLQPFVDAARAQLLRLGPSIETLAESAADKARSLSDSTRRVADQRREPESSQDSNSDLSEQQTTEQATELLREALVDLAEAQNFVDSQQVATALLADAGIQVVDQAQELLRKASNSDSSRDTPTLPNARELDSQQLDANADMQVEAAEALATVAEIFRDQATGSSPAKRAAAQAALKQLASTLRASDLADRSSETASRRSEDANQPGSLSGTTDSQRKAERDAELAERAQRLADLAGSDPNQVLAELESRLAQSAPMQSALSSIARQAANEALLQTRQATLEQNALSSQIELSDPQTAGEQEQLIHHVKTARRILQHVADTLLRELELTTQLAKSDSVSNAVRQLRDEATTWNEDRAAPLTSLPSARLKAARDEAARQLNRVRNRLDDLQAQLEAISDSAIHQNGAELNNRRRAMRDRSKNLLRKHLNFLQAAESRAKQLSRTAESNLQESRKRLQQAAQQSRAAQTRLEKNESEANRTKLSALRQKSALHRIEVAANERQQNRYSDLAKQAGQTISEFKSSPVPDLETRNPSASWAANLAQLSSKLTDDAAMALDSAIPTSPSVPRGEQTVLEQTLASERNIQSTIAEAEANLSRAARHETRLDHPANSLGLKVLATATHDVSTQTLMPAHDALLAAWENARDLAESPFASQSATETALRASSRAHIALNAMAEQIDSFLHPSNPTDDARSNSPNSPGDSPSALARGSNGISQGRSTGENEQQQKGTMQNSPSANLLSPEQMARLLDELDQQLNETDLGAKEDDAENPTSNSRNGTTASTLAEAARSTAQSMSRARSPTSNKANADLGTATDADAAKVAPEGPVAVELLKVERVDGDWGKLRAQANEKAKSSDKSRFAPDLQRQVDAYFERIAESEEMP